MSEDSERTFLVELRVSSSDGEVALDYFGESVEEVLDAGTFQGAICEHLGDNHPVNTEILSALLRADVPPEPDWFALRAAEELPDGRRIMASFAEDRRVKVLPTEAEVEVVELSDGERGPGDVLWTFRVLVPHGADTLEPETYPERETDYSRLVEVLARAGVPLKSRGLSADVPALGLELRFAQTGELETIERRPDPMELTLGEAQSLTEWAAEGERRGGLTGWGPLFNAAMVVAQRVRRTCAEVFSASDAGCSPPPSREAPDPRAERHAVALLVREVTTLLVQEALREAFGKRIVHHRAVDVLAVAELAGPEILEMTPGELRAHAALVLDRVSR